MENFVSARPRVTAPGHRRYRKQNTFLRRRFGERVYRIGLCGGFTCPNRDRSKGERGCLFCNPASSEPLGFVAGTPLSEQLTSGVDYVRWRHEADKFIAFFMDYTTTYADVERLEAMYREAISFPGVVGLAISTRPDCLPGAVLDLLEKISRETFLWIELGVQSAHTKSLEFINRRHSVEDTRKAIVELRRRRLAVSGHVILGLPGESAANMLATADFLAENGIHGAKIHNLHIVSETPFAEMYGRGEIGTMELDEYVDLAIRFLERLPPGMIIQRLSGEAPRRLTVAPAWAVNKLAVVNAIEKELQARDTWQGKALGHDLEELREPVLLPQAQR
jgi:radical SAM protein (TIGR01212 family)